MAKQETDKQEQGSQEKGNKGKVLARNCNGALHLRNVRSDGWSEEERGLFLDHLAATCNVAASAQAAGHVEQSASGLRRRNPEFRDQWDEALETGYARLEAMMLEKTHAALSGQSEGEADHAAMRDAMALLEKHRAMVSRIRQGREAGYAAKTASAKHSYKEIVQRLQVLKKRLDEGE